MSGKEEAMSRVVVVYHSGSGHTKSQAEAVVKGVQKVNKGVQKVDSVLGQLISVDDFHKHEEDFNNAVVKGVQKVDKGVQKVNSVLGQLISVNDFDKHEEDFNNADAIIFGCPTYMGSASADFKKFMDATSKIWQNQEWAYKIAAGFTNSGSQNGDKLMTLTQLFTFAMQHSMVWIGLGLMPGNNSSHGSVDDLNRLGSFMGAMAQSNMDQSAQEMPPFADLQTAEHLGARVAEATLRWKKD